MNEVTGRQGDVLLIRVDSVPHGATLNRKRGDVVLMHGEVTGHAHRIKERRKVRVHDLGAQRFIEVLERTALTHEEHGAIFLDKGVYRQAFQVEDYGAEIRPVVD